MSDTIYYLSTCDTCRKILKEIEADNYDFKLIDIKATPLSLQQVEQLAIKSGSYESLINKRATLFKEQKLGGKNLSEDDFKELLLQHYTFLKRPAIDYGGQLFIGNDKKTIAAVKDALRS